MLVYAQIWSVLLLFARQRRANVLSMTGIAFGVRSERFSGSVAQTAAELQEKEQG